MRLRGGGHVECADRGALDHTPQTPNRKPNPPLFISQPGLLESAYTQECLQLNPNPEHASSVQLPDLGSGKDFLCPNQILDFGSWTGPDWEAAVDTRNALIAKP